MCARLCAVSCRLNLCAVVSPVGLHSLPSARPVLCGVASSPVDPHLLYPVRSSLHVLFSVAYHSHSLSSVVGMSCWRTTHCPLCFAPVRFSFVLSPVLCHILFTSTHCPLCYGGCCWPTSALLCIVLAFVGHLWCSLSFTCMHSQAMDSMGEFDGAMAAAKAEAEAATRGGPPPVQMRTKKKVAPPPGDTSNPFAPNPFAPAARPASVQSESSDDRKSVDGKKARSRERVAGHVGLGWTRRRYWEQSFTSRVYRLA